MTTAAGDDRQVDSPDGWRAALEELAAATDRLLGSAHSLDDDGAREPTRLPGWTRGHVLTHLARNADALANLVHWAATGKETPMYASPEARDADIERGAGRPAGELVADLETASTTLLDGFAGLDERAVASVVRMRAEATPARRLPSRRLREVEIHHVDLAVGYTPAHWPEGFTARTLDDLAPTFRDGRDTPVRELVAAETGRRWEVGAYGPTLRGQPSALLAWLTGRSDGDGLSADPEGLVPPAPRWA